MNGSWINSFFLRPELIFWASLTIIIGGLALWRSHLLGRWLVQTMHTILFANGQSRGNGIRLISRSLALLCWSLAILGPSWGNKAQTPTVVQRDILLAIDMSRSMRADDIAPSRLQRVRDLVAQMTTQYATYRYGLVVFAANAWIRVPFTYDRAYINQLLAEAQPEHIQPQGTNIAQALSTVLSLAEKEQRNEMVVVLISDGEHTGPQAVPPLIQKLRDNNIHVVSVAIGELEGAPIPLADGGYQKDSNGEIVFSKPDRDLLLEIARKTGGAYVSITSEQNDLSILSKTFDTVKSRIEKLTHVVAKVDRSIWFIATGWILLLFSLLPVSILGASNLSAFKNPKASAVVTQTEQGNTTV